MSNSASIQMIGIGSPVVDYVLNIDDAALAKVPGQKGGMELVAPEALQGFLSLSTRTPVRSPGGSAGNTTFAMARMGVACAFLGKLGEDDNGVYYQSLFKERRGDCSRFKSHPDLPTACCVSLVTPDSERTMRTALGAASTLSADDIDPKDFAGCAHAHVEGYLLFNPDLIQSVLKAAKAAGCTISLDLGSFEVVEAAREILPGLLADYVDIVFANEEEAAAYCGSQDLQTGLNALAALCPEAVVKVGKDGAWLKEGEQSILVPARPVENLVDTTGAGDYWAAGYLFGRLNGFSLAQRADIGALLSSHVISVMGAVLPEQAWDQIMADPAVAETAAG